MFRGTDRPTHKYDTRYQLPYELWRTFHVSAVSDEALNDDQVQLSCLPIKQDLLSSPKYNQPSVLQIGLDYLERSNLDKRMPWEIQSKAQNDLKMNPTRVSTASTVGLRVDLIFPKPNWAGTRCDSKYSHNCLIIATSNSFPKTGIIDAAASS